MDPIYNDVKSPDFDVTVTQDPQLITLHKEQIAQQINYQRMHPMDPIPPMEAVNLADQICDITIETSVQGSGILEIQIADPAWDLLRQYNDGQGGTVSFFDVDSQGYLWPPIDLNFPADVSDAMWRLCALRPSTDLTGPNLTLTFEDKVASVLREFQGPVISNPNETRAEFIRRLVKEATVGGPMPPVPLSTLSGSSSSTSAIPGLTGSSGTIKPTVGQPDGKIRFIALLEKADFSGANADAKKPPFSKKSNPSGGRKNPNKDPSVGVWQPVINLEMNPVQIILGLPPVYPITPGGLASPH